MITTDLHDDVATITLDDGKVNAFTIERLREFETALGDAAKTAKAIIITGRKDVFSAGLDLNEVRRAQASGARDLLAASNKALCALLQTPVPVIAAASGHAVALGGVLLCACDYRIGAHGKFRVGVNATANGIQLTDGIIALLAGRLNGAFKIRSVLGSEVFDPAGAAQAGFMDEVVDQADVLASAKEKANVYASYAAPVFAAHKAALYNDIVQVLMRER